MMKYSLEPNVSESEVTWVKGKRIQYIQEQNDQENFWIISGNEVNDIEIKQQSKEDYTVKNLGNFDKISEVWIPEPVYVVKDEQGHESVYYNSNVMEKGKFYQINWEGEKWALEKTDKEIKFHKWIPNK